MTPIKTLILNALKSDIVPLIAKPEDVFIDPSRGLREDLDEYVNIFTDNESSHKKDLSSEKIFQVEIHSWIKRDTDDAARDAANLLSATIQSKILPRTSAARTYCVYLEEAESNCNDILYYAEGLCVVISRYEIKYRHAYGNPFQFNP